jgi:predicted membrane protein
MSSPLRQRTTKWAAIAALGPISGPLVARMLVNWRRGDHVLAVIYGVAVLETALLLPVLATRLLGAQLS